MNYRKLGRTGVEISTLTLGTMTFGAATDANESVRMVHAAMDRGVNSIDTANIYVAGRSEELVGQALADRRDRVVLATKGRQPVGGGPNQSGASRLHLMHELEKSLRRLRTDYVDLYYVHTPDRSVPIDETLRALDDMVRSGKVRYSACSNFRAWHVCEALWMSERHNLARLACVQPLYNIINRDIEVELLPLCEEHRLGVISYSPMARGVLSGKYVRGQPFPDDSRAARGDVRIHQAEIRDASFEIAAALGTHCEARGTTASRFALAWCVANPRITSVIVGPRNMEQFEDNLACLDVEVSAADEAFVDELVPPGEHSGKGFQDPLYPVTGRGGTIRK